ncbi:MAG: type II toxin-antitoxin system RelB/DinJ family antitoxin [Bacilli bacterium]|nr:type II toxin-antitoxin system RelB/DinJ family antitoxin [Bacilli bacterium]
MDKETITVRLDHATKREAEVLFAELGMSMSAAITIFLKQAVREGKIPFEIKREKPSNTNAGRKVKPLHKK